MTKRKQDPEQELLSRLYAAIPDRNMQVELWKVAIHESGHGILATYMGCDEITFAIWPADTPGVQSWSGRCAFSHPAKPRSALWFRYINLAGAVAVCLMEGRPLDQVGLLLGPAYNGNSADLQGAGDYRKRDVTYVAWVLEKYWSEVLFGARMMVEFAIAEAEAA